MKILKNACAGTLESSDAFIEVLCHEGVKIELESSVKEIYGKDIQKLVKNILKKMEIKNIYIKIQDKGALDFVLEARIKTAILRACEKNELDWSKS